ncbi:MAG: hypothetical protein CMI60_12640 [Parvibaculum sp.]|nr:hypothetical protein [Parvibaculum sp.]
MTIVPINSAQNVILAKWACEVLGDDLETFGFDRYGEPLFNTVGFEVGDELACVVVAYHYAKPNVTMAFASKNPRWATKGNIASLGEWVFEELGCNRVTAFVQKQNKRARKFDEGIGFKYEGKLRKATYKGDVIAYGLTKEDHHEWLRKAFNGRKRIDNSRGS